MRFPHTPTLLIAALLLAGNARAEDEIKCVASDQLKPGFNDPNAALRSCVNPATASPYPTEQCQVPIQKVIDAWQKLVPLQKGACDSVAQYKDGVAQTASMSAKDVFTNTYTFAGNLVSDYKAYLQELNARYEDIRHALGANPQLTASAATDPDHAKIIDALKDNERKKIVALPINKTFSTVTEAGNDPTKFSTVDGADYLKKIQNQINDGKKVLAAALQVQAKAQSNLADLGKVPDPQQPPGSGTPKGAAAESGLDLKNLAALATAGAGLASAMNKQNQAQKDPMEEGATSPTPSSKNDGKGAKDVSSSKFGDNKPAASSPVGATMPKKDTANTARVPSGGNNHDLSDISKSTPPVFANSTSTPATAKAGGGGGGSAKGGGDPDGGAAAAAAAAAAKQAGNTDDSQQGINGGALGGGGPPSLGGSPGAPPGPPGADAEKAPAEAAMTDLLHEMKETAEGGATPGEAAAAANDITMSDEDLFPRVRACYVRVMKAGRVLDGLGEKITQETQ